jgi:putative ABC transport system substrate-binding protein
MRRRDFMALMGGGAIWPLAAHAQQPNRLPRVGVLIFNSEAGFRQMLHAFIGGMEELGYKGGKNIRFEIRHSDEDLEKLKHNARELVAEKVDLIWVPGTAVAQAAREATASIPIVFALVSDPVQSGFVRSLASPGTNMTGMSLLSPEMWGKRLELLLEVRADVRRLGVLAQPGDPATAVHLPQIRSAAVLSGRDVLVVEAGNAAHFPAAFGKLKEWRADALFIAETGFFLFHRGTIIDEATRNRWPTVNSTRQYAEAGGLISYGVDYAENCKRSAAYVDRVLKGAAPASLPVQQPARFELVVNLKAATALGIAIPPAILARADEVIE